MYSNRYFNSQVVEKELLIKEKEKLYMELKQILARQPGPEVAEQLSMYQSTAKEKTKQMKVHSFRIFLIEFEPLSACRTYKNREALTYI